jgi:hypothetical protein
VSKVASGDENKKKINTPLCTLVGPNPHCSTAKKRDNHKNLIPLECSLGLNALYICILRQVDMVLKQKSAARRQVVIQSRRIQTTAPINTHYGFQTFTLQNE